MLSEGSKTKPAFSWLLLLSLVTYVSSMAVDRADSSYWGGPEMNLRPIQACGSELDTILELVCAGKFAYRFPDKRSTDMFGLYRHRNYYPYGERHSGLLRNKRQVVDECCRRTCNQAVLEQYCGRR